MTDTGNGSNTGADNTPAAGAEGANNAPQEGAAPEPRTFSQEDLNRLVGEARRDERKKFSDYDTLKAKAAGALTVEEQLAEVQRQNAAMQRDVLAARVAARHGISQEDSDLFLIGKDEETLNAQAARLAALRKPEAAPKRGPFAPLEGRNPKNSSASEERRAVRALFGGDAE